MSLSQGGGGGSGGSTPTGTGVRKVVAGVEDAAASLVVNADVNASAAIAVSKLAASGFNESILKTSGGATVWSSIDLSSANAVGSSILPKANGGHGQSMASASGVPSWATGTLSFKTTPSGAIVGDTDTQTLTNKSVSGPSFDASSYLSTGGGTVHTTALIRVPYSAAHVILGAKNSGASDYPVVAKTSATGLVFGDTSAWDTEVQGFTVKLWSHTTAQAVVQVGSTEAQRWSATKIETSLPFGGSQTNSVPFRWRKVAITQSTTADTTLTAAQYECSVLDVSGTPGGNFNVIAPNTDGAFFLVKNRTANGLTIKKTGGTGVTIATGTSRLVFHDGTDYVFGN